METLSRARLQPALEGVDQHLGLLRVAVRRWGGVGWPTLDGLGGLALRQGPRWACAVRSKSRSRAMASVVILRFSPFIAHQYTWQSDTQGELKTMPGVILTRTENPG